jgi:hypothetical protein
MWQAISCVSDMRRIGGGSTSQIGPTLRWQRVAKRQPAGTSTGLGVSPFSLMRSRGRA